MIPEKGKVLVDFYATWCGPCKMVAKSLEKYEEEVKDVTVVKINVDQHSDIASKYGIRSIPALFFVEDGAILDKHIGMASVEQLKELTKVN
jgi:thioredoxin 1